MNSLVGLFPTYAALFDHFGKVAEQKSYTVSRYGNDTMKKMFVPAKNRDGTPCELVFVLSCQN